MLASEHGERGAVTTSSEGAVEDERVLRRLFDLVYSEGDLRVARELVAPGFRGYCSGTGDEYHGSSGVKAHASRLRSAFPGLTVEIDGLRRTSAGFEASLVVQGRFERAFGGIEPTCVIGPAGDEPHGPRVTLAGVVSGTMAGGQLREWDIEWDLKGLPDQR